MATPQDCGKCGRFECAMCYPSSTIPEIKPDTNVTPTAEATPKAESAFDTQVSGNHYNDLDLQPLEICLRNKGYLAFVGACYTKILKYTSRIKDDEVEQLRKARHVLDMWIEEAEKQP